MLVFFFEHKSKKAALLPEFNSGNQFCFESKTFKTTKKANQKGSPKNRNSVPTSIQKERLCRSLFTSSNYFCYEGYKYQLIPIKNFLQHNSIKGYSVPHRQSKSKNMVNSVTVIISTNFNQHSYYTRFNQGMLCIPTSWLRTISS